MNKTLNVDGVDYKSYMAKHGYTVGYKKILGPNSCTTLDGRTHEDVIAEKAIVNVSLRILNTAEIAVIQNAQSKNYVVVTYFDTKSQADKTVNMKVITSAASLLLENSLSYWGSGSTGISLTLEEI